jgi:hypothetical protein
MTNQEKLDYLIALMYSDEFDMLFDEITGIDNVGGEEKYRNLVNDYIDELCSFGDLDAYDDDENVSVMVDDFILYCENI